MARSKGSFIYGTLAIVTVSIIVALYFVSQKIHENEQNNRKLELTIIHAAAINQLKSNINQFAAIAASMRTYFAQSVEGPVPIEFQHYTNELLDELNFEGQYVVSVLDSAHHFRYVFDRQEIDPNKLAGKPIPQVKNPDVIARMDSIMLDSEIHMSRPINLYEGWLGISFSFSYSQDGHAIGYVTPILGLKDILEPIYSKRITEEFVFKFQTANGEFFDREKIYNPSSTGGATDPEYFENFDVAEDQYIQSSIEMFGQVFYVGTAFKKPLPRFSLFTISIMIGFFLIIVAFAFISVQGLQLKSLNDELYQSQAVITEQKQALEKQNKELKQLNTSKDLLFSILGHDLKSPISTLYSMMDLLLKKDISQADRENMYHVLKDATKSTMDLLDNLLKWALLNADSLKISKEKVNLILLAKQVAVTVEPQASEKGLQFHIEGPEVASVYVDPNMIQTAVRNIVTNAIKFTPKGGTVSIKVVQYDTHSELIIADTGIGISSEQAKSLFVAGEQQVGTDTKGKKSTGFGLVLAHDFITRNGGSIHVASELHKGTTFTLRL